MQTVKKLFKKYKKNKNKKRFNIMKKIIKNCLKIVLLYLLILNHNLTVIETILKFNYLFQKCDKNMSFPILGNFKKNYFMNN